PFGLGGRLVRGLLGTGTASFLRRGRLFAGAELARGASLVLSGVPPVVPPLGGQDGVGRGFDVGLPGPGQSFLRRATPPGPPAPFRRAAPARVVLARERLAAVLPRSIRSRQREPEGAGQVAEQAQRSQHPASGRAPAWV